MMAEQNRIPFDSSNTFKSRLRPHFFTHRQTTAAVLLASLLLISGCLGAVNSDEEETLIPDSETNEVKLSAAWGIVTDTIELDGTPAQLSIEIESDGENWQTEIMIITPQISLLTDYDWEKTPLGFQLSFVPEMTGEYNVQLMFIPTNDAVFVEPISNELSHTVTVCLLYTSPSPRDS